MASSAVQIQALTTGLQALSIERRRRSLKRGGVLAVNGAPGLRLRNDRLALKSAFYNGGSAISVPDAAGGAPPRISMRATTQGAYICRDCGYIYNERKPLEKLSDDYRCPVCAAPKRRFKPYDAPVARNANDLAVRKARKEEQKKINSAVGWVDWGVKFVEGMYKGHGLEPRPVEIDDGATSIHCWAPRAASDDGRLASKPALLFIQGFGFDGKLGWQLQIGAFAQDFRVYVPDLLFFGNSYTTSPERSEIFQADCLKKMLDALKVDRVHVVGSSYGGMVAYRMAHKYPDFVDKVVIASSGVTMTHTTNSRLYRLFNVSSVKEILTPHDVDGFRITLQTATALPVWLVPSFALHDVFERFYAKNVKEKRELLDGLIIGSVGAPPIPKLKQKVLILWGTEDQIFDLDLAESLKE